MIALMEARQAGLFARQHWLPNLVAGLIVGIVALPLAMAFAIASGVKPEQGLYTAIVAGVVVSLFGGSRVQIAGPTGAFITSKQILAQAPGYEQVLAMEALGQDKALRGHDGREGIRAFQDKRPPRFIGQ